MAALYPYLGFDEAEIFHSLYFTTSLYSSTSVDVGEC